MVQFLQDADFSQGARRLPVILVPQLGLLRRHPLLSLLVETLIHLPIGPLSYLLYLLEPFLELARLRPLLF